MSPVINPTARRGRVGWKLRVKGWEERFISETQSAIVESCEVFERSGYRRKSSVG